MRKRLLILAALLTPLLALIGFVLFVAYTEVGVRYVAERVSAFEKLGLRIEGVSGVLAGPLYVKRFELKHPRVHVVVHDIEIDVDLRGLWVRTLQARAVTARDALVEIHDIDTPRAERPPRFLPRLLRIDARGVQLARVRYVHLNGTAVAAQRVRGRATITSDNIRVRGVDIEAEQFDARGDFNLQAARPLGMQGAATGRLRLPRAQLALNAKVDGDLDRLEIVAELLEPSRVSVDALFTRPEERWRLAGTVKSTALALDPFLDDPPLSLRNVDLEVVATQEEIHAAGNVGVPEFNERDLTVDARGRFKARVLHLSDVDLALNDSPAKAHVAGSIAFHGDAPTLDLAARWQTLQWPVTGQAIAMSAQGAGTLRGAMPYDFAVDASVAGPGLPSANGVASGALSKEQLTIASYDIEALQGRLQGAASLQFAQPRAWTLSAKAHDVDPGALHAQFPGRLNFVASAKGAGIDKNTAFDLDIDSVSGVLRQQRVRGAGYIRRQRSSWTARGVDVRYGQAHLTLDGTLGSQLDARWSLDAPSLEDVLPNAAGSLELNGSASGPRATPHVIVKAQGARLRYEEWMIERLAVDANIDVGATNPSRIAVAASNLGRVEPMIGELQLTGEGVARDHKIDASVTGFAPRAGEPAPRAVLAVAGRHENERWDARVTTTHLTRGDDKQFELVDSARIAASRDEALLENLCVAVSKGRLCAQGRWQRGGAWEGQVAGYEIPLAFLLPPAGQEAEYAGRIEGRVRANGAAGRAWQGDAGMRIIDAAIIYRPQGAPPETLNLGTGGLAATATPERIALSFGVQAFTDTFLYANAQLQRDGRNDILNLPLKGDVRARAADANVLPLLYGEIDHAAGLVTATAAVQGSLAAPAINGRIELADGELDSYRVNLALRDLGMIAELHNNRLDFRGSGRAGEGVANLDGGFEWSDGVMRGSFHLRGQDLLVADLPEYRVVASPDLRFVLDDARMNVVGDVAIPSALIQPNELTGAVRASDDARYVDESPRERAGDLVVHSEVRIHMGDDVRVDAFGLQGRITGGVGTTVHTRETPIGRGELAVDEGRYEAYGQELEISRGQLLFDATPLDDPALDIEARRQVDTTIVGLNVRGTLQEPRLTFFSNPSMPQTQIVSYLLTGKSIDSMQTGDTAAISSIQNTLALQGGGLLASQIGRRLGLEEVGVESSIDSTGETNTALVLGKFLSPRLFISYGISLTESINTLKLRYTISDRWVLKTEAGEHQSADVEFRIER